MAVSEFSTLRDSEIVLPGSIYYRTMMTRILFIALCLAAMSPAARSQSAGTAVPAPLRETLSLDEGWRFHLGDIPLDSFAGGVSRERGHP